MNNCPFCAITNGTIPGTILANNTHAYALKPLHPITPGHTLIIPYEHVENYTESPTATAQTAAFAAQYAKTHLPGPTNLITSQGQEATQSVNHLHFHLIPRKKDDGLALPWYSGKGGHTKKKH